MYKGKFFFILFSIKYFSILNFSLNLNTGTCTVQYTYTPTVCTTYRNDFQSLKKKKLLKGAFWEIFENTICIVTAHRT